MQFSFYLFSHSQICSWSEIKYVFFAIWYSVLHKICCCSFLAVWRHVRAVFAGQGRGSLCSPATLDVSPCLGPGDGPAELGCAGVTGISWLLPGWCSLAFGAPCTHQHFPDLSVLLPGSLCASLRKKVCLPEVTKIPIPGFCSVLGKAQRANGGSPKEQVEMCAGALLRTNSCHEWGWAVPVQDFGSWEGFLMAHIGVDLS